jgi:antitoxin component YwqK of YwqJK toxin-antitoxin module
MGDYFVYKSCGEWIVFMKKISNTITNEGRDGIVDRSHAKFRANVLFVVRIANKFDKNKTINSVQNTFYEKKITYIVGKQVGVDDFDTNIYDVCSTGIHFFNSYKAAFFFEFPDVMPEKYTGKYNGYYCTGQKMFKGNLSKGKEVGLWIQWFENGQKKSEGKYTNGKHSSFWIYYYENGRKQCEGNCSNGKRIGLWNFWKDTGEKIE